MPPPATPAGRFLIAFDADSLAWNPTWTRLDSHPSLVTSYTIDRGRQFELDRTDGGRATVEITDRYGILDPTNPGGPYYEKIEPLRQARIGRQDPVTGQWHSRFRGFVEEWDYSFDPSQRVNRLSVALVDLFEKLGAAEMQPGKFGNIPPADGQVVFPAATVEDRINRLLDETGVPAEWRVVFSGNVDVYATVYSPGETVLAAVQEAADAEFPGVSNVYVDRFGRLAFHGRLAKFDPEGTSASAGAEDWDYTPWQAGDGARVADFPGATAHIRTFGFSRGLSRIINSALATPVNVADSDIAAQLVTDTASITTYGVRSWSAQNLLTQHGLLGDTSALEETRRFAEYYTANYAQPRNRISEIGFRSMHPDVEGAAALWKLLGQVDIADSVAVTASSPGGGGFTFAPYFVEGVHETCQPLNPDLDDVTLTLDLSPRAYYDTDPWAE